jgi:hypothetical protein
MRKKIRQLALHKETVIDLDRVAGSALTPPSTPVTYCTGTPACNGCSFMTCSVPTVLPTDCVTTD